MRHKWLWCTTLSIGKGYWLCLNCGIETSDSQRKRGTGRCPGKRAEVTMGEILKDKSVGMTCYGLKIKTKGGD